MNNLYLEVVRSLRDRGVRYLVVGGFAVNFHGYNRTTGDLDIWVNVTDENLDKLTKAIESIGFAFGEEAHRRLKDGEMVAFSNDQELVELMSRLKISQYISFDEAFERSELRIYEGVEVSVISLKDLIEEKSRSKRYKDLDDLSKLEEAQAIYSRRKKE